MVPNGAGSDPYPSLLAPDDPHPVSIVNQDARSSFLLIGDHAGNAIPKRLGTLGLSEADRTRHIAWDIGIAALGPMLADALDAPFVSQHYSRLVIDCNRAPEAADAMPEISDHITVPGNAGLSAADRAMRVAAIHTPYQAAIEAVIKRRDERDQQTILVALHSFTPSMSGTSRPWQIGVLHDAGDPAFARSMLEALGKEGELVVGDNEPYRMDLIDYTIPRHAYPRRRGYVEIEIRQDLLASGEWRRRWTDILARTLRAAEAARHG